MSSTYFAVGLLKEGPIKEYRLCRFAGNLVDT